MKRYIRSSYRLTPEEESMLWGRNSSDESRQELYKDLLDRGIYDAFEPGTNINYEFSKLSHEHDVIRSQFKEITNSLENIFAEYGLEVDGYPGRDSFVVHPPKWPWPYKYCRHITFGNIKKNERDDILVPLDYVDGYNTTLPEYAIKQAVAACKKPIDIMKEQVTGWPDSWLSDKPVSDKFISQFLDYAKSTIDEVDAKYGIDIDFPYALPTAQSEFVYVDNSTDEVLFDTTYGTWLTDMYDIATTSKSRREFESKYINYIQQFV